MTSRPDWMDDALCTQVGDEPFFPSKGQSSAVAKRLCAACPSKAPCLVYGMDDPNGVYGGLSPNERKSLRRANGSRCGWCGQWFVNLPLHVRSCYRAAA